MATMTRKHCTRCGTEVKHTQEVTEDCGLVWRCFCCFKTTPVRKYTNTEPQWKTEAKANLALELANRS